MTVVETQRLWLRPWRADDLDALADIFAIPAVFWYPSGRGLRFGFEDLRLDRIVSIFAPENAASGRVMVRLGMQPFLATKDPNFATPLEVRQLTASAWRARAR